MIFRNISPLKYHWCSFYAWTVFVQVKCNHSALLLQTVHLNYYLSYDVCGFPAYVCPKKKLFNGCKYQKILVYKVVTFLKRMKMAILFWIFLDQIRPNLIKLDQIGYEQMKNKTAIFILFVNVATFYSNIFWLVRNPIWSSLIKFDPFWTDLIQKNPK